MPVNIDETWRTYTPICVDVALGRLKNIPNNFYFSCFYADITDERRISKTVDDRGIYDGKIEHFTEV